MKIPSVVAPMIAPVVPELSWYLLVVAAAIVVLRSNLIDVEQSLSVLIQQPIKD